MRKITQDEFDALPIIDGVRQCPGYTDYAAIKTFGESCSFGKSCSFGERCSFGEACSFGESCSFGEACSFGKRCSFEGKGTAQTCNPLLQFHGFGSRQNSVLRAFNLDTGIWIRTGCFLGTLAEFRASVTKTHGDNAHGTQYQIIADLIEARFTGEQ